MPRLVLCVAAVDSRMDVMEVVLRWERWKHQGPVCVHQTQVCDLYYRRTVPQIPRQLVRGAPVCRAIYTAP
jgi:hypothetical protein